MIEHAIEHVFSYTATLAPPEIIGPVPEGIRINLYVTGGEITGEKVRGKVRPVGGDWLTIRRDGVGVLDVRATGETHDGALIYMTYSGVIDFGHDGYEKVLRGEFPPVFAIRAAPRLATAHPAYEWLNRLQFFSVGTGEPGTGLVRYDVYAIR